MQRIIFFLLMLIGVAAQAQTDWILVGEAETRRWEVKPGSLEFSKTKGGTVIAVVVGRIVNSSPNQVSLYKWYVSASDCKNEMGKMVSLGVDGEYKFENDFVFGSGNVASSIAQRICGAADLAIKARSDKGL